MDINGVYRVQTTRIESLEVSKQIMATPATDVATNTNVNYALSEFTETPDGVKISVIETPRVEPVPQTTEPFVQPSQIKPISISKPSLGKAKSELTEFSGTLSLETSITAENEIGSIDSNTFMESLNLKSNHGESKEPKNIDNFSVIKKYAKKKRPKPQVTYIMEELEFDEDGNMIKMQTFPWDLNASN